MASRPTPGRWRRDPALRARIVSGVSLAPLAVGAALAGGWWFASFVAVFAFAMAWEWTAMSDRRAGPVAYGLAMLVSGGAPLSFCAVGAEAALGLVAIGAVAAAVERAKRRKAWRGFAGVWYVSAPCIALVFLRQADPGGLSAIEYIFAVLRAADIAAYVFGFWIGGPKLLPVASPNKTWTGLAAALVCGSAAGAAVAWIQGGGIIMGIGLAAPLAMAAVSGDLMESLLKRRFGVKDAGRIIPGHGGVLDRVDALMLASSVFALMLVSEPRIWPIAGGGLGDS
ncbi:MAG: phosphatidate cytidylyltransferase [Maricaulaceae bacterium]